MILIEAIGMFDAGPEVHRPRDRSPPTVSRADADLQTPQREVTASRVGAATGSTMVETHLATPRE